MDHLFFIRLTLPGPLRYGPAPTPMACNPPWDRRTRFPETAWPPSLTGRTSQATLRKGTE